MVGSKCKPMKSGAIPFFKISFTDCADGVIDISRSCREEAFSGSVRVMIDQKRRRLSGISK